MMVPDHRAGTTLRCPRCGIELRVPAAASKTVPSPVKRPAVAAVPPSAPAIAEFAADLRQPEASRLPAAFANSAIEPTPIGPTADEPPIVAPPPVRPSAAARPMRAVREGWAPPSHQATAALYLSLLLAALALFGVSPAVWEWFDLWRNPEQPPVPPWVFALLITGVLQLAYAVYLSQAPDWSTLWATTIATLTAAAAWAALLGATLLGRDESVLVTLFRYADKLQGNRAAMWCFIMLCFTSVLAYFLGHTAVRWQRSYKLLRQVRGG